MITPAPDSAARAPIADLRFAAHLAGDEDERLIEQPGGREIFQQGRKRAVELRQEPGLQAVEIIRVHTQPSGTFTAGRDAHADVVRDASDRGVIALLNEHGYRALLKVIDAEAK